MEKKWWKESVVYQIYPKSFKDNVKVTACEISEESYKNSIMLKELGG